MFPIRWNFPFRKKDGSISTIGDEISAGGGGGGYTLPTATASRLGGVKIGSGITVQEDGTISASGGSPYELPTASAETKGGIKIGSGLAMDGEVLNNSNPTPYSLPTASAETKGGVKVGDGLSIDANGVLKDSSTVLTTLSSLVNVDSGTDLKISNDGEIYTISGYIELTNELNVNNRVQIGNASIPEIARPGSGYCPMLITMADLNITKFTIATLTVYANGNIFINNNFADIKAKYLFVCCQYRKMNY